MHIEAADLNAKAEQSEAKIEKMLPTRFAEALIERHGKGIQEGISNWDSHLRGTITRAEFATAVKSYIPNAANALITELYETFDRAPSVDMTKLKASLMRLVDESKADRTLLATLHVKAKQMREKAAVALKAAEATKIFEAAIVELERTEAETTTGARLGQLMIKKGLSAKDIVEKWDENGTGEISMDEFRRQCFALGLQSTAAQVDALFMSLDADGGGSLDKFELRAALKKLEDAAYAHALVTSTSSTLERHPA